MVKIEKSPFDTKCTTVCVFLLCVCMCECFVRVCVIFDLHACSIVWDVVISLCHATFSKFIIKL